VRTGSESDRIESLAVAVAKAAPDFDEQQQLIALEVYRRIADGSPAPTEEVAERVRVTPDRVRAVLASWPGVFLDDDQRVIGFWGLTTRRLVPTHRFRIGRRELFAWCAWDTLFLPGILRTTAAIESTCPTTGEVISLVVSPDRVVETSHPDAVVSFLTPERNFDADVIQGFCHFVHFFASEFAGGTWSAKHPGTFLLSLQDAFELGRRVNALNFPGQLGIDR
jgi:alkylmercury lyase